MIEYNIKLSFPLGANFFKSPNLLFYKKMMQMIKKLNCVNSERKCRDCPNKMVCNYYRLSGEDFLYYPGIVSKISLFDSKIYQENQELNLSFYLIGDCHQFSGYIDLFFQQYLNQNIGGIPFYIKSFENKYFDEEEDSLSIRSCVIKTPIEREDLMGSYNQMIEYYDHNYHCLYSKIKAETKVSNFKFSQIEDLHSKRMSGYIGSVFLSKIVDNPNILLEIGIGKFNYLGGGKIAIKDSAEKTEI